MLYKSGVNLEQGVISFIEDNDEITLFSAYLRLDELKKINSQKKIKQIIVRWEIQDLCIGVSDIDLYEYCLANKITLKRNTRIHLKAFWNNNKNVFFGSANVTGRGIGERGRYNYELNGCINELNYDDIAYFNYIIINSEYVTSALYDKLKKLVDQTETQTIEYPKLETKISDADYFLLSSLPMSESIEKLYNGYCSPNNLDINEINYVSHDIALYSIPNELDKSSFHNHVKETFNSHPFIIKLKEHIKNSPRQSLNYGGVVNWTQENTTTVPIPRRWDIKKKKIVNILYGWLCELDEEYTWNRPNHSQVIHYNKLL